MTRTEGLRVEDERFLRGRGRYTSDLEFPHALQAFIVRSPHAHASLGPVKIDAALRCKGVVAVFRGCDLLAAGIGPLPCRAEIDTRDGAPLHAPDWRLLAADTVRYVGEGVAIVVAESLDAARDAAELLDVDYRLRPAQVDPQDPFARCFDWEIGDAPATRAAFERAAHVASMSLVNNRVIVNPLETRSAVGVYDSDTGRYTLYTPCQGVHMIRLLLAEPVLGVGTERLRVRTPDVGGGFGIKFAVYPEQGLVLFAARKLGRPVRWVADREEAFLADAHARDHRSDASLALDAEGRFLGMRISTQANLGAYLTGYGPSTATHGYAKLLGHVYRIPAAHLRVRGVLTHSAPVEAYRGAGAPEMVYLVERLVELAAEETGIDRVELRRRNLVAPDEMPYTNPSGRKYRDCDFPRAPGLRARALRMGDVSPRAEGERERGDWPGGSASHSIFTALRRRAGSTWRSAWTRPAASKCDAAPRTRDRGTPHRSRVCSAGVSASIPPASGCGRGTPIGSPVASAPAAPPHWSSAAPRCCAPRTCF